MIKRLLDILISRCAVVALMLFVTASGLIAVTVPQRSNLTVEQFAEWQASRPQIAMVAETLQLDRVFSSVWFVLGLLVFTVALVVATARMLRTAWRHTVAASRTPSATAPAGSIADFANRARAEGYREVKQKGVGRRFVRHRLGWWGSALMHLGMVLAVTVTLAAAAFTSRGVIDLSAGEVREPGDDFLAVEPGALAGAPELGLPLRFEGYTAELWPNGELRSYAATISVVSDLGTSKTYEITANDPLRVLGHVIYVSPGEFGEALFVELSGENLPDARVRIEFPVAAAREASYSSITPDGWPSVQARWDPDLSRGDKPLALRVVEGETESRVLLDEGESGEFGPYAATFAFSGQWARLIIVRAPAVNLIFLGFAIIGLGSVMIYAFVPRELVVAEEDGVVRYAWQAARMPRSYEDERDRILGRGSDPS